MQFTNLKLSGEEAEVLNDTRFFVLKHSVTAKITALFGELEKDLKSRFPSFGIEFEGLNSSAGKIFRGENYRQFPYILLDYPRQFSTESIFAFRSMLWWGHEFSFTLHLQGKALASYRDRIEKNSSILYNKDVFYCVHETPWQYHFEKDNYVPFDSETRNAIGLRQDFLKFSRRIPVSQFERAAGYCIETFELFFTMLKNQTR